MSQCKMRYRSEETVPAQYLWVQVTISSSILLFILGEFTGAGSLAQEAKEILSCSFIQHQSLPKTEYLSPLRWVTGRCHGSLTSHCPSTWGWERREGGSGSSWGLATGGCFLIRYIIAHLLASELHHEAILRKHQSLHKKILLLVLLQSVMYFTKYYRITVCFFSPPTSEYLSLDWEKRTSSNLVQIQELNQQIIQFFEQVPYRLQLQWFCFIVHCISL